MLAVLKSIYLILFSILAIYLITRKKFPIGITILYLSLSIFFYLGANLKILGEIFSSTITNLTMYRLMIIIFLILFFSKILNDLGLMKSAVGSLENIFKKKSGILPVFPALIGLLPMPGGAMFSAPMVKSISDKMNLPNEDKTFINFWFRHIWEPILPLYPGFILQLELVQEITRSSNTITNILLWQFPITILMFLSGYLFKLRSLSSHSTENNNSGKIFNRYKNLVINIWPIILLIVAVILLRKLEFTLIIASCIILVILVYFKRLDRDMIFNTLKTSFSFPITLLIFSVFFFQNTMSLTGILENFSTILNSSGIPIQVIVFILPFIVGFLSGLTITYIAISFPLILPFISTPDIQYNLVALGFMGGYFGVLLSPVHLCLVLTNEYFQSNLSKVYFLMLKSLIIVFLYGILISFL
ncbi:MAG: DUF401 family protein [bacterium]|nr:DUF401 family protein [bacterium]